MSNNNLILRSVVSPWITPTPDFTRNSVLSFSDVDNNFIYLKGELINSIETSGNTITLKKINGNDLSFNVGSGGGSTYWASGSTGFYSIKTINDSGLDATGNYSVAEGFNTLASGSASHAEGVNTLASGNTSHAEGLSTTSSGDNSHSEGLATTSSGDNSHAEGESTVASGNTSHAEGINTIAGGDYSHAEGQNTTAGGINSHAEGFDTTASDESAHAEGDGTLASGPASHAEGANTVSSGIASHAEGQNTTASANHSHAEGQGTTASGNASHAGGNTSIASGDESFIHSTNSLVTGNRSVVLGGQNITGATDDTVYVPNLNINNIGGTTSVTNLGIDSSGNVVSGTTSLWSSNVNGIHYNSGNVGIGTTTSSVNTKLEINYSDSSPERAFRIKNTDDNSQYNFRTELNGTEHLLRFDSDNSGISPLVLSSDNKVGVGIPNTIAPEATLHVYSTSSSQPIVLVEDEANPDATPFIIDIDGNVGIGTGTPNSKLDVSGSTGNLKVRLDNDNSNDTNQLLLISDEDDYTNFISIGSPTPNAELQFGMVGPSSTSKVVGDVNDSFITATSAADDMNFINNAGVGTSDNIAFYAGKTLGTDLSATTSDIIILGDGTDRGYVGLGLSNPSEKLEVSGNTKISGTLNIGTLGTGTSVTNLGVDGSGNVVTSSGGASGVLGISNSGGTYTYYSDFTSAIAAASAGDTIEMFADIEETTNTTVTLIDGITINGNGHTYTLNVDNSADAFTFTVSNGTAYFNNIKVLRTGRSSGTASGAILNHANNTVKCQGVVFINDYGRGIIGNQGDLHNAHVISVEHGIYAPFSTKNLYNCHIEVSSSSAKGTYLSAGNISNCYVKANGGDAISNGSGRVYNSVGITTSGIGIVCNGEVYNSTGQSTSGRGMLVQRMTNCVGVSSTSTGIQGEGRNCVGISTSGVGGSGKFYNSTLISSSNYAASGNAGKLIGSTAKSTTSIPVLCGTDYEISNSNVTCDWNNTGGHCTTSSILLTATLTNNKFKVANASAYCISAYVNSTWNYANNSFEGPTTPITPTLTQGITNTSDSQGNILL